MIVTVTLSGSGGALFSENEHDGTMMPPAIVCSAFARSVGDAAL